ncbi:uncharacterized protein F5891DRAFT_1196959 [Suillus fuscotomentosus]|uniref:SAP domain-containing protein n=1 Tax=Suillus fuscotomentosus TaxID=1912939 RepID=A0AAD4HDX8_9AGAM|nr:uncharacterized protein F5891DRAFT_1196959 [Suillus fuscotomentosus]KAG1892992.1 hypothetical protein F5891DRAFT_1196959 [Suillus fuscotomentosus]
MSQHHSESEELELPVLGQMYTPGQAVESFIWTVTAKTTKANLHEKLKSYDRPTCGNRMEMLDRLRQFSNDRDEWLRPKLKRKRGEHASRQSLSKRRIEEVFGIEEQTITYKSKKSANRTQRALQDDDQAANSAWAHAVLSAFGMPHDLSVPPITQRKSCHQQIALTTEAEECPQQDAFAVRMRKVDSNMSSVREDLSNVENHISVLTSHILDMKTLMKSKDKDTRTLHMETRSSGCHNTVVQSHAEACIVSNNAPSKPRTMMQTASMSLPPEVIPPKNLGIAHLGQEQFSYDRTTVPSPPTVHLSKDINQLCEEWEESNLLVVNGRGIPVKYWGEFYKKGKGVKTAAWDALRVEWGNWKFIAEERQRYPDNTSFWRAFSDENSKIFSYQQILNRLAEHRVSAAARDAKDARDFFGGNLNHPLARGAFCYTKGGRAYLSSKDDAVAKKWRELLTTRPDIVEQRTRQIFGGPQP